jgi:hypothetical protein
MNGLYVLIGGPYPSVNVDLKRHLVRPFARNRELAAPILVHTSLSCVSIPILASWLRNAIVDCLLVLLQNRNGIDEARRRCIARVDPGMG